MKCSFYTDVRPYQGFLGCGHFSPSLNYHHLSHVNHLWKFMFENHLWSYCVVYVRVSASVSYSVFIVFYGRNVFSRSVHNERNTNRNITKNTGILVVCICGESEGGWGCVGVCRLGSELCEQWCQFGSDWPIVFGKYVSDCQVLVSISEAGERAGGAAQECGLMCLHAYVTVSMIVGFLLFSRKTTKQTIMLKTTPINSFIAQNRPGWVMASRTEYSWQAQLMQII